MKFWKCIILIFLFQSCQHGLHIEKRRYTKGLYVHHNSQKNIVKPGGKTLVKSQPALQKTQSTEVVQKDEKTESPEVHRALHNISQKPQIHVKKNITQLPYENNGSRIGFDNRSGRSLQTEKKEIRFSDKGFLATGGMVVAINLLLLSLIRSRTRRLSEWARTNTKKAKSVILSLHLALSAGGFFVGREMAELEIYTTNFSELALMASAGFVIALYPVKQRKWGGFKNSSLQKFFSILLTTIGFFLMTHVGIKSYTAPESLRVNSLMQSFNTFQLSSEVQMNADDIKPDDEKKYTVKEMWWNAILSLLFTLLFVASFALIAALSCGLSCNGHEILAVAVALVGWAGLVVALIYTLKWIWKPNNPRPIQK